MDQWLATAIKYQPFVSRLKRVEFSFSNVVVRWFCCLLI